MDSPAPTLLLPEKKKYQRYHSALKLHIRLGGDLKDLTVSVPKSTLNDWKHQDFSDLAEQLSGLSPQAEKSVFLAQNFLKDKPAQILYEAFLKISSCYQILLLAAPNLKIIMDNSKKFIVKTIETVHTTVKHLLPLKSIIASFAISVNQFYRWKNDQPCSESLFNLCLQTYPFQLLKSEVDKIKLVFQNQTMNLFPSNSLYWHLRRKNILHCCLSTFYKYAKKLGLKRNPPRHRRKNHETGIRALKPNQIWHADVTCFTLKNGLKSFLYFITDNFSRRILSWKISLKLSHEISLENLHEAYTKFRHLNPDPSIDYIVDGGSENNNSLINHWPPILSEDIRKLIAQQSIRFSNSMAESTNRIMKYVYLYHQDFDDFNDLQKYLEFAVKNHNEDRFHHQLNGLTPKEAFEGKTFDKTENTKQIRDANRIRLEINRKTPCPVCDDVKNITDSADLIR